jgi:hypothetical protein
MASNARILRMWMEKGNRLEKQAAARELAKLEKQKPKSQKKKKKPTREYSHQELDDIVKKALENASAAIPAHTDLIFLRQSMDINASEHKLFVGRIKIEGKTHTLWAYIKAPSYIESWYGLDKKATQQQRRNSSLLGHSATPTFRRRRLRR